jgi:hypothetical protein
MFNVSIVRIKYARSTIGYSEECQSCRCGSSRLVVIGRQWDWGYPTSSSTTGPHGRLTSRRWEDKEEEETTSCLEFFGRLMDELVDNHEGIRLTWAGAEQDVGAVADAATAAMPTVRRSTHCKPRSKGKHMRRGGAVARNSRSNPSTSAARVHTPLTPPRSSSGSAIPWQLKGANTLPSTSPGHMPPTYTRKIRTWEGGGGIQHHDDDHNDDDNGGLH